MLTPTETEVLKLTAQGLAAKEIANVRKRSKRTIETHRLNIKRKLQAKSTCQAIAIAKEKGLL
jgi:DNA-binding CsgD family transcriptional regulator